MPEEYTIARKPFGPVLTGEDNYEEFQRNAEDFLSTKSLWGIASGVDTLDDCVTRAEMKSWKEKNSEAIGYYRGNCSERIKNKFVGLTTCAGMVAMTETLFKPRSREQGHQILASILRSQFIDGDDFEKFVLELEGKNDRLAAMGMECSEEQLLLALKASLPPSYDTTLQGFNTRLDGTYEDLRRLIMNDYKTKVAVAADARAYYLRQNDGPPVDARAYMMQAPAHILRATANIYLFTREDGKLCTNDGKVVDCRKCGANHTAVDCTQAAPIDVQNQSRNAPAAAAPAWAGAVANAVNGHNHLPGPNHARNVQKRTARKIQRAAAQGDVAQPFIGMMRSVGAATTSRVYAAKAQADTSDWMLDSGATINGTPVLADLTASSVKAQYTGIEGIKGGDLLAGTHVGTVDFKSKDGHSFQLGEVVHTTQMSDKIISLQRLADRGAVITLIKDGGTVLLPNKISLSIARKNGFWCLSNVSATAALSHLSTPVSPSSPPKISRSSTLPSYRIVVARSNERRKANFGRWHKRLCHPGLSTFKRTVQGGLLDGLELGGEIPEEHRCAGCAACKATRLPHQGDASVHRATRPLQSIKIDLSGRTERSAHGEEYYMLIRDGYSHYPWVFLLKQKSDAFPVFVKWQNAIENKIPFKVAEIHSDQGSEFINNRWGLHNAARGITSYVSNVYTAPENGVAERGNRTEKGRAGAALKESGLPSKYWGYCIQHAVLCDGVLYSVANPAGKSSYEVLFGERPNVKDFRAPGTPGWVYIPEAERRGNLQDAKAQSGRCLGMNKSGAGWVMLMDDDQRIRTSSNVVFWENDLEEMPPMVDIISPPITPLVQQPPAIPRFRLDANPFAVLDDDDGPDDFKPDDDFDQPAGQPAPVPPINPIPAIQAPPPPPPPIAPPPPHVPAPLPAPAAPRRSTRTRIPTLHRPAGPRPQYHGLTEEEIESLELIDEDEDGIVAAYLDVNPPAPTPAALNAKVRIATAIKTAKDTGILIPKSWSEAMASKQSGKWKGGEAKEFGGLREKRVFDIVDRKVGQVKPIPCHFVYALKKGDDGEWMFDGDGELDGQKVRLVAGGNFQDKALLVEGSYSATASGESVRFILGESARPGFSLYTADVKGAYLEADLPYDVFLYIPKSNDPELEEARKAGKILKLNKCLYGLVESGMFWSRLLKDLLVALGYKCLDADKGVYALHEGGKVCYVPTHVDDLLGATDCPALWRKTIEGLSKRVSFSKNGPVGQHLGALIEKAMDGSVYVSMESYIVDMNTEFGMRDCSPCPTPMLAGTYVTADGPPLTSITQEQFVTLVAKLNWIFQVAHPEIAVPVKSLGRHLHNPTEAMFLVAKRVMRYLQGAKSFGICFRYDGRGLIVFCDADWAGCLDTRQSRSGWLIWRNGPVSWGSLLQGPLALSLSESEYYAACTVVKRALPIAYMGHELRLIDPTTAIPMFIDNTSAIHMISSPNVNQRTRHIAIRYHYIKKAIREKVFAPSYIESKLNPADLFTKALGPDDFVLARAMVGVVDVRAAMLLLGRAVGGVGV